MNFQLPARRRIAPSAAAAPSGPAARRRWPASAAQRLPPARASQPAQARRRAAMAATVLRHSVVQVETKDALRGRVGAVHATSILASNQLGQFRAGMAAEWMGPAGALLGGGVATVLIAVWWARLFPELLKRDRLFRSTIQPNPGAHR